MFRSAALLLQIGIFAAASLYTGNAQTAHAAPAERVIVFVIDGLRQDEGVAAKDTYIPWLWNSARPNGTLITELINRDATITEPAHRMMFTGLRHAVSNYPWYPDRELQRNLYPTIFEELDRQRDQTSLIMGNTVFMESQGWSIYPGLGKGYGALSPTDENNAKWSDKATLDHAVALMASDDPSLIVINLHDADKAGHSENWIGYTNHIRESDRLIQKFVQENLTSQDAVIVVSDHGRHDGERWRGHGDSCAGCRTSWLLAFGAGIAKGVQINGKYELLDITPTIAALLDIELPTSLARPIREALTLPTDIPDAEHSRVNPWLASSQNQTLHEVAQQLKTKSHPGSLLYRRSTDEGITWSEWETFGNVGALETPETPKIWAQGDAVLRAWRSWIPSRLNWGLFTQSSTDDGVSWSESNEVTNDIMYSTEPAFTDLNDGEWVGLWSNQITGDSDSAHSLKIGSYSGTWSTHEKQNEAAVHLVMQTSAATVNDSAIVAFSAIHPEDYFTPNNADREIFVATSIESESQTANIVQVADTLGPSLWPELIADQAGTLHIAWAEREPAINGKWFIQYATSPDGGLSWSSPLSLKREHDAWRPTITLTSTEDIVLAWVETDDTSRSVNISKLRDSELGEVISIGTSEGHIGRIALAPSSSGIHLAWHEGLSSTDRHIRHEVAMEPKGSQETAEPTDTDSSEPTTDTCGCVVPAGTTTWCLPLALVILLIRRSEDGA